MNTIFTPFPISKKWGGLVENLKKDISIFCNKFVVKITPGTLVNYKAYKYSSLSNRNIACIK